MEGDPPCSDRIARGRRTRGCDCFDPYGAITRYGHSFQECSGSSDITGRSRSLATTSGVSVDVLSSRYSDVSVPWVCFVDLWISESIIILMDGVSPFGNLRDQSVLGPPELIAAYHVLHRLSVPRHPPNALVALDLTFRRRRYDSATTTSARSVQGTRPHDGLHYPFLPLRLGDGARKSRL